MSDESLYDVWIVVAFAVPFTLVPYLAYAYFRRRYDILEDARLKWAAFVSCLVLMGGTAALASDTASTVTNTFIRSMSLGICISMVLLVVSMSFCFRCARQQQGSAGFRRRVAREAIRRRDPRDRRRGAATTSTVYSVSDGGGSVRRMSSAAPPYSQVVSREHSTVAAATAATPASAEAAATPVSAETASPTTGEGLGKHGVVVLTLSELPPSYEEASQMS